MIIRQLVGRFLTLVICAGFCFFAGCSSESEETKIPALGNVRGVVTLDGKPLEKARVEFHAPKARPVFGFTDEQGHYEMIYDETHKGAAVGQNQVKVSTLLKAAEKPPVEVPVMYNEKSILKAKVLEGDNEINFDLKSN